MNQILLDVCGLSASYSTPFGRVQALRNVNLQVRKGKITGIVGESGCGKSTLLSSIIGLLDENTSIDAGSISYLGLNLLELSSTKMRALRGDQISMIFQDPLTTLNPVISIGKQMLGVQFRSSSTTAEKRQRAVGVLDEVGISDAEYRLDQFPHQLSGGMCQRVSIGMALLSEPQLLLADEPTTALDATLEVEILDRLRSLQQRLSCAIIFVSHNLGVISELCDEVSVMYAGEVVEQGDVQDIFLRPKHPYVQRLLECDPSRIDPNQGKLPTILGDIPDLITPPDGCSFASRCHIAVPRCRLEKPLIKHVSERHTVACHLVS